jgi:hypothetical protein
VSNDSEAVDAIKNVDSLKPSGIRKACQEKWDLNKNFEKIFEQMISFYNGDRW